MRVLRWLYLFFLVLMTSACVNDLESIERVTFDPKSPDESTKNLHLFYTDSGYAKIELFATIAETFIKPKHITKLQDGLKVLFYSDRGEIVSRLTAQYGELDYETGIVRIADSVELFNFKKQQRLETEELFWNRKDSSIFTKSSVVVRSPKGVLFGDGIKTKQDFSSYEFLKPRGEVTVN